MGTADFFALATIYRSLTFGFWQACAALPKTSLDRAIRQASPAWSYRLNADLNRRLGLRFAKGRASKSFLQTLAATRSQANNAGDVGLLFVATPMI